MSRSLGVEATLNPERFRAFSGETGYAARRGPASFGLLVGPRPSLYGARSSRESDS
jgi:hypothetical protein